MFVASRCAAGARKTRPRCAAKIGWPPAAFCWPRKSCGQQKCASGRQSAPARPAAPLISRGKSRAGLPLRPAHKSSFAYVVIGLGPRAAAALRYRCVGAPAGRTPLPLLPPLKGIFRRLQLVRKSHSRAAVAAAARKSPTMRRYRAPCPEEARATAASLCKRGQGFRSALHGCGLCLHGQGREKAAALPMLKSGLVIGKRKNFYPQSRNF